MTGRYEKILIYRNGVCKEQVTVFLYNLTGNGRMIYCYWCGPGEKEFIPSGLYDE
jgi:hypothetical protein